ncbi:uncharacterized protein LOC100890675 isoform X1 [Strongylocentrotus purpuratus]|uniref:Uncharacterized protein n=1 Tax=Strongylocentrotus purpuratus TaxID=7668 RepID=A0A7M7N435_STRPU|nr:uncharacterized protein LOC100890675 isoform X1 [Strongylocentrotus purpuratus]
MATAERDIVVLKMDDYQCLKGKQEMLSPKSNKNLTDGNVGKSGEDTPDSVPSSQASGPDIEELVKYTQPKEDEKRDLEKAESEDNTDAMPSNKPIARVSAMPQSTFPLPQQPCNEKVSSRTLPSAVASSGPRCEDGARQGVERNTVEQTVVPPSTLQQQPCDEEVSTRTSPSSVASPGTKCEDGARQGVERNAVEQTAESEDNTDAVPSNEPTATVTSEPQSTVPLPQQPCDEEVSTRTRPSSDASLGTRCEDGPMQEVKRNAVEQAINLEDEKDLIFYEIAEQVAGSCDLRKMALRLGVTESPVAQVEHDNQQLVTQFYKVFRLFDKKMLNPEDMIKRFLEVLVKTDQVSTAAWLRKRLGIRDLEASLEGGESSPVPHVIPQTETTGRKSNDEFFDIFLVHTGKSENTKKFQTICDRHKWVVKSTMPVGTPVHQEIERMLNSSTHLALIITESDCIRYKNREMSITVEMALQLAYNVGELAG